MLKWVCHIDIPFFQWKGKGVSIPLFSLRSEKSAGIGDFIDLRNG